MNARFEPATHAQEDRLVYRVAEAGELLWISRAFAYELVAGAELPRHPPRPAPSRAQGRALRAHRRADRIIGSVRRDLSLVNESQLCGRPQNCPQTWSAQCSSSAFSALARAVKAGEAEGPTRRRRALRARTLTPETQWNQPAEPGRLGCDVSVERKMSPSAGSESGAQAAASTASASVCIHFRSRSAPSDGRSWQRPPIVFHRGVGPRPQRKAGIRKRRKTPALNSECATIPAASLPVRSRR